MPSDRAPASPSAQLIIDYTNPQPLPAPIIQPSVADSSAGVSRIRNNLSGLRMEYLGGCHWFQSRCGLIMILAYSFAVHILIGSQIRVSAPANWAERHLLFIYINYQQYVKLIVGISPLCSTRSPTPP